MDAEKDYNLLSEIMHNANIGWWKADIQDADYIYYGPHRQPVRIGRRRLYQF